MRLAAEVAYAAIGQLPARQRGAVEGWLGRGGLAHVAAVLPGWTEKAGLSAEAFRSMFFGADGRADLSAKAQAVGTALAGATAAGRRQAGTEFATPLVAAKPSGMERMMAGAAAAAAKAPVRAGGTGGAGRTAAKPAIPGKAAALSPEAARRRAAALRAQNIEDMARVIYTEARGNGPAAMTAVGHTIRNRMLRNGEATVQGVWSGYSHGARVSDDPSRFELAKQIATGIIDGTTPDPTNGATHYYSPQRRDTLPLPVPGKPNEPLHETTPGALDRKSGGPGQNTYPSWSRSPDFAFQPMPGIPEKDFRFFRQVKPGHTR